MGLIKKVRYKRAGAQKSGEILVVNSLPASADRAGFDRAFTGLIEHYGAELVAREPFGRRYSAMICGQRRKIILADLDASVPARFVARMNDLRDTYHSQFITSVCSASPSGPGPRKPSLVSCHLYDRSGRVSEYNHNGQEDLISGFAISPWNREIGTTRPLFEQGDVIVPGAPARAGSACTLDLYESNEIEAVTEFLRAMFTGRTDNSYKPMMACLALLTDAVGPPSPDRFEAIARATVRLLAHAVQDRHA